KIFPINNYFSAGKMITNKKLLTKKMLLDYIQDTQRIFPGVQFQITETEKQIEGTNEIVDAMVDAIWEKKRIRFVVETQLPFNPKSIQEAIKRVKKSAEQLKVYPLILTPYLSEEQLEVLEELCVSGIDLCGNSVIVAPGRLLLYRSGNPNKYPSSSPIRNVYRGTSSIVARTFLLRPEYETSQELLEEIVNRGGEVTLPTISKVSSALVDELILERKKQGRATKLRLLQPEKLLDRLAEKFEAPVIQQQFIGKLSLDEMKFQSLIQNWKQDSSESIVLTGSSSSDSYATMAREPIQQYYCTDLASLLKYLGESVRENDRFPNIQIYETDEPTVYFDIRNSINASPLQTFLELNTGEKRERETAEQVRESILNDLI
ncbi:hypothetical protein, partial [uncultured Gimesia sp.]|uniref:hypothetical protein n=1 Tax=uncultured Gimesia sp. TaxID=1678688 RepID=UPI0026272EEB